MEMDAAGPGRRSILHAEKAIERKGGKEAKPPKAGSPLLAVTTVSALYVLRDRRVDAQEKGSSHRTLLLRLPAVTACCPVPSSIRGASLCFDRPAG
jgi:hypothetical protein